MDIIQSELKTLKKLDNSVIANKEKLKKIKSLEMDPFLYMTGTVKKII